MTEILRPDLCVLGGGTAGIAAASAAAGLGAKVVLVEKRALGSPDHTIVTQAFCAAAQTVATGRAGRLGIGGELKVDLGRLRAQTKDIVAHFARETAPARLVGMNIRIIRAAGLFTTPTRLEAGGFAIDARHFVVATGATPSLPAIAGLELLRLLTPDELVLGDVPKDLILIGANFDELALAQALVRLGSKVVLLAPGAILPEEDQELIAPVLARLVGEGLVIHQNVEILSLEPLRAGGRVNLGRGAPSIEASHIMVSATPLPCVEGFGLKTARVGYSVNGIKADANGKTSNPRIRAIGGVVGSPDSTMSARHRGQRVANALFGSPQGTAVPLARVLSTDPEMAVVGLSEADARAKHKSIRLLRAPFSENERARTAFGPQGHVKIVTDSQGHILGAGIVGPQARELIGIFSLAIAGHMKAADLDPIASTAATLTQTCRAAALASGPQVGKAWWRPRLIR
jgi:pyruvate/2-oxoglutarate dehydrogenase complex dihydrolipoamide dehydrogenase (E3) component